MSTSFPYREGNIILLETDEETHAAFSFHGPLQCKIKKFYQPSTLSCVMEVEIEKASYTGRRFVLKLYDRRYATQLRKDYKIEPISLAQETAYFDFVKNGNALEFLVKLREDEDFEEPEGEVWNDVQNEVYLLYTCLDLYGSECAVYDRLKDRQGRDIPQLIAKVRLPVDPPADGLLAEFYEIKGILLELIDGFTLRELADKAPREDWQKICDQAVRVVQLCNDREILNEDVRPANFMVSPLPSENNAYRVVMLDFGQCRLRNPEDSDLKWGRNKCSQDEEGAIGIVMQHRLKKLGFDLTYQPSRRYAEWACTEDDDDPMLF